MCLKAGKKCVCVFKCCSLFLYFLTEKHSPLFKKKNKVYCKGTIFFLNYVSWFSKQLYNYFTSENKNKNRAWLEPKHLNLQMIKFRFEPTAPAQHVPHLFARHVECNSVRSISLPQTHGLYMLGGLYEPAHLPTKYHRLRSLNTRKFVSQSSGGQRAR